MINLLRQYNQHYMQNCSCGNEDNSDIFEFSDKKSKLIITAPHATKSFCNKKVKCADLYTGALVKYIGEKHNVSTIIRSKYTPYKAMIIDYIEANNLQNHYFLDIHGFNQDVGADICLGIGNYEADDFPYLNEIIKTAEKYNLKTMVNHPNYTGLVGLTGRYQKKFRQPNVIQIEIIKSLRDFENNPASVVNVTLPFLTDIAKLY